MLATPLLAIQPLSISGSLSDCRSEVDKSLLVDWAVLANRQGAVEVVGIDAQALLGCLDAEETVAYPFRSFDRAGGSSERRLNAGGKGSSGKTRRNRYSIRESR